MKTTNKNHPVWGYIENAIGEEYQGETLKESLQNVVDAFDSEYNFDANKRRYKNIQQRFSEWLMGLPSALEIEYRNFAILELAKKWGSIPENATERQEDKIIENWFNFISAKFFQLCKKQKVEYNHLF